MVIAVKQNFFKCTGYSEIKKYVTYIDLEYHNIMPVQNPARGRLLTLSHLRCVK